MTTSWLLYPGACVQRALGTWSSKSTPVADSLQPTSGFPNSSGYTDNQPDFAGGNNTIAYTRADLSLSEKLWHVVDSSTPVAQRPAIISGLRSLWCGNFDSKWAVKVGYPSNTFQILYFDTGTHGGNYNLSFTANLSSEQNYDYNTIVGGGTSAGNPLDPLTNNRAFFSAMLPQAGMRFGGPDGNSEQIVSWTGSILTPQSVNSNGGVDLQIIVGAESGQPNTVTYVVSGIPQIHRALYWVFTSDNLFSSQDGLWPWGHGQIIDLVSTSDNGSLYDDQTAAGGLDPYNGDIIRGTYGTAPFVSARVPAGVGELWQLAPGIENVTNDVCAPQKKLSSDLFFEGGDPNTNLAINKQFNSIVSCTFPIPVGTASVFASWTEYIDLPRFAGFVQSAEYRFYKGGAWSDWRNTSAAGEVHSGARQSWGSRGFELAEATQADSVQLRWTVLCLPEFAADVANCSNSQANALLYDNLLLRVTSGVPPPTFGIFPGSMAQTTFVDGTIDGTNCAVNPCWPGNRGSDLDPMGGALHNIAVNDNWNATTGDSITLAIVTGLRKNGMGVNWKDGLDKTIAEGENYQARHNGAYNAAFDFPRMVYRVFDPATKSWSPFDSCQIYPDVAISDPDTIIINSEYAVNWPPDDKLRAGASLPGGFTVNGVSAYSGLRFMPRGSRIQYYWKAVDINGGLSYQFSSDILAREVEDLPTLPGSSLRAPDIIEFDVLPRAYAPGPVGSLLAGKTDTPILNLDAAYTFWSHGYDPVTQALRAMGVRADRYRHLNSGFGENGIGGHALPGKRPGRLSNFFPNYLEYAIVDSLAKWYRIMIESSHSRVSDVTWEQDATLSEQWWRKETGTDLGDRCFFASGDDMFNNLINATITDNTMRISFAQNVFGVSTVANAWSAGDPPNQFPTIDDRFSAPGAGPALGAPGTFTYPVDGGCPGPKRFDALGKVGDSNAQNVAFFPNAQVAGIAYMRELDAVADKDRNKALGYGFSFQYVRDPAVAPNTQNYARSGVENRMRVLYKFLTSCRGQRSGAPSDTGRCWPCPSPPTAPGFTSMQADWAGQSAGFQTGTWGPLYPIQAGALATAVEEPAPESPPHVNALLQNRPNPFNPETVIPYSLAIRGRVVIRVFDVMGRCVRTLVNRVEAEGIHSVRWNGKTDGGDRAASGVYFYRITYPDGEVSAKKLMIVR